MRSEFTNKEEDIKWLKDTHLHPRNIAGDTQPPPDFKSFIFWGNADCPQKIILFDVESPSLNDKAIARYNLTDELKYTQVKTTREKLIKAVEECEAARITFENKLKELEKTLPEFIDYEQKRNVVAKLYTEHCDECKIKYRE